MENLINYGYTPVLDTYGYMPARITAVYRERYEIVCENGFRYAKLKTSVYFGVKQCLESFPTVGDFVLIDYNNSGDSLIVKTLERKSYFIRKDPGSKLHRSEGSDISQIVAANFDYVFIVSSINYDLNLKRIERYLTLSYQSGAIPIIVLTKCDLKEDFSQEIKSVQSVSGSTLVHAVSSKTGYGIDELSQYLKPRKTIVFMGSSGVGKSSLVNTLSGKEIMKVNEIREDDSKGRHTTTHRQLIKLDSGAMIIDTPGMRELGMWNVEDGIVDAFSDVESYFGKCKFSNCTHTNEPGCAILAALNSGELSIERWNNYNELKREARYSDNKLEYTHYKKEQCKKYNKIKKQLKKHKIKNY